MSKQFASLRIRYASHQKHQRLSQFWDSVRDGKYRGWVCEHHGLDHVTRKDGLAHAAKFARLQGRKRPNSEISTWTLPDAAGAWRTAATNASSPDSLFIYKPASSSCGHGIVVGSAKSLESHIASAPSGVVSRYTSPLLIGGLKWDMRCYALLLDSKASGRHLYLFLDGLARFATKPYAASALSDSEGGTLCVARCGEARAPIRDT